MKKLKLFSFALVVLACGAVFFAGCDLFGKKLTDQAVLEITAVTGKLVGDTFQLETTGGSGSGAVTYEKVSGAAAVSSSGAVSEITAVGDIVVKASKAADKTYKAAASEQLTITIGKGLQTDFAITAVGEKKVGNEFQLATTGGKGTGAVIFEKVIDGTTATATVAGNGNVTNVETDGVLNVKATIAGDANYQGGEAELSITIIEKLTPAAPTLGAITYSPMQTLADISLPAGWTWVTPTTVPTPAVDTYSANFAGDEDYKAASAVAVSLTVDKATPTAPTATPSTVTFSPSQTLADISLPSGWTWRVPTIVPNVTSNMYEANFAGDAFYNSATYVLISLTVQPQQLTAPTGLDITDTTLTWTANADAMGYTVNIDGLDVDNTTSATYSLAGLGAGNYGIKVLARSGGNLNYSNSIYSTVITHIVLPTLSAPTVSQSYVAVLGLGQEPCVVWAAITDATSYSILIKQGSSTIVNKNIGTDLDYAFLDSEFSHGITYKVTVMAHGNSATHQDSAWSNEITYTHYHRMETPQNVKIRQEERLSSIYPEYGNMDTWTVFEWDTVTMPAPIFGMLSVGIRIYVNGTQVNSLTGVGVDLVTGYEALYIEIVPGDIIDVVLVHGLTPGYRASLPATVVYTTVPFAPQDFTATYSAGQVVLAWSAPENDGASTILGYEISIDEGASWITASGDTGHTLSGYGSLPTGLFIVRAVNAIGDGQEAFASAIPNSVVVGSWQEISYAIQNAAANVPTTLVVRQSFEVSYFGPGVISIPSNRDIILVSSDTSGLGIRTIATAYKGARHFYVNGGKLTLGVNIVLTNTYEGSAGGISMNGGTSTLIMEAGSVIENCNSSSGGAVFIGTGKFYMNGGTIQNNTAALGGGVYIANGSEMYMIGGTITGNVASNSGGGVYVSSISSMNKTGGTITGNSAPTGPDVHQA